MCTFPPHFRLYELAEFSALRKRINAKIGGFASILDSEVMNELEKEPFMILGENDAYL